MVRLRVCVVLLVPALLLPCCAQFGAAEEQVPTKDPTADASKSDGPEGTDGAGSVDGSLIDATHVDAPDLDAADAGGPCDPACKGMPPCGVKITTGGETYCIDPTEVTVAQYKAYLATQEGKTVELPAPCGITTIAAPSQFRPANQPVTHVSWCDATAYCRWAGKRLCGTTDGKALSQADYTTQSAAWYHACTHGNAGYTQIGNPQCRFGASAPLASGTTCQGGYPGVFDMPGNVWEYIDYVVVTNGFFIGNGFSEGNTGNICATVSNTPVKTPQYNVGFRCCSY